MVRVLAVLVAALLPIVGVAAARAADHPVGIVVEEGLLQGDKAELRGPTASRQLVLTGKLKDGSKVDATRSVKYVAVPAGVVRIDETGLIVPLADGSARVTATVGKASASLTVAVSGMKADPPVSFRQEIVPLLTKLGCNGGSCHGKTGGQNHFALSLFGFEPGEDFEFLAREPKGRRVFPASPENSLLLRKAAGQMAHAGGKRFEVGSPAHAALLRWIRQGTPFGEVSEPAVTRIDVVPSARLLSRGKDQQLAVLAHRADGSVVDVTRLTRFDSNNVDLADVSATGLVTAKGRTGNVAVMARYDVFVGVFEAMIPLGEKVASLPAPANFIDEKVFDRLKKLGLPPSVQADDATLLRRVTIDVAGRLPTLEEVRAFFADADPNRYEKAVDRLLASEDYAYAFANKWSSVLRNRRKTPNEDPAPTVAFHSWIKKSLHENKPYDQFVREILTAEGKSETVPQLVWYREVNAIHDQVEDAAQLFLGQRIMCARCHHHPLEKWSQDDYYGLAAFFSRVEVKTPPAPKDAKKAKGPPPFEVVLKKSPAKAQNPKNKKMLDPAGLDAPSVAIGSDADPREKLVDWMVRPENPFFSRALVNRYWKHFFGRGLVEPEDDLRLSNPPTNPELLDALASHFASRKYDLKDLVRTIVLSRTYRLSSEPNAFNRHDQQNFSRFVPRRLHAEVLLDAIDDVIGTRTSFPGMKAGTRAMWLPDNQASSYFLDIFGRPDSTSACECERSSEASLVQALHLANSQDLQNRIAKGRLAKWIKDNRPHAEKIQDLYLLAFGREPTADERKILQAHIDRRPDGAFAAYEDIFWSVINSKEFFFTH